MAACEQTPCRKHKNISMSRNTKIYLSLAIVFFAATLSRYARPVANEITYGIALLGVVFSVLTRMAYNREKRNSVKDKI